MRLLNVTLAAALVVAAEAGAQTASVTDVKQPAAPVLRYRFTHVPDGVMRLDHQTGQVVFCKSQAAGKWLCNAVPEQGEMVQAQLRQVDVDNGKLPEQLSDLQKQLATSEEERKTFKDAIDNAQAASAAAKSELGALRQEIAALKQQVSVNQAGDALKAEMATVRAGNEALATELAGLRKDIVAIGTAQRQSEAQRVEITRLQTENRELSSQIGALQQQSAAMQKRLAELEPPRPPAPVPAPKSSELKPQLPSRDDLAQARAAIVEAWKRVVEMLNDLRNDLTGKNDNESMRL